MRKHWIGGMLLGVSLALLLAGGVAVAAGYYATISSDCVLCVPAGQEDAPRPDQILVIEYGGWGAGDRVCHKYTINSESINEGCSTRDEEPEREEGAWLCDTIPGEASAADPDTELGVHVFRVWPEGQPALGAEASWLVVRDKSECPVEFVPEPGTVVLLGSGLVGLAGYATLRWRTRE